jgi:glucan phosphoethanolaminetransferase (alkaline phosphatase superfamily)
MRPIGISKSLTRFVRLRSFRLSRESAGALAFTVGFALYERLVLGVSHEPLAVHVRTGNYRLLLAGGVVLLASWVLVALFVRASLTADGRSKAVYFSVFILSVFIEYGYYVALRRLTSLPDLEVALFATSWALKRDMALIYFNPLALAPGAVYGVLLLTFAGSRKASWRIILVILGLAFCFNSSLTELGHTTFVTSSLNATFRTATEVFWHWQRMLPVSREAIAYSASTPPDNSIVLIVDESVRGDHLSINGYARETTPYLDKLQREGLITNWDVNVSGTNCSMGSNQLLMTGFSPAALPDPDLRRIRTWPSIFQYAKAMGYRTYYFDGQLDVFSAGTRDDLRYIDERRQRTEFHSKASFDKDSVIAAEVAGILDRSVGNFIWINKLGIHYPYAHAFPEHEAKWRPWSRYLARPDPARREELINSYDNALRYNLESFFRRLDPVNRRTKTVFLYTSDHGQNLSERGEVIPHCGDIRNSCASLKSETLIPIFMLMTGMQGSDSDDRRTRVGHYNIFPTLLDLMRVPQSERRHIYGQSLLEKPFRFEKRSFFVGASIDRQLVYAGRMSFDE